MNYENFFKGIFESYPIYGKTVIIMFLIENDKNLLKDVGFTENDSHVFIGITNRTEFTV